MVIEGKNIICPVCGDTEILVVDQKNPVVLTNRGNFDEYRYDLMCNNMHPFTYILEMWCETFTRKDGKYVTVNKPFFGSTKEFMPGSVTVTGFYPNRAARRAAKNKK